MFVELNPLALHKNILSLWVLRNIVVLFGHGFRAVVGHLFGICEFRVNKLAWSGIVFSEIYCDIISFSAVLSWVVWKPFQSKLVMAIFAKKLVYFLTRRLTDSQPDYCKLRVIYVTTVWEYLPVISWKIIGCYQNIIERKTSCVNTDVVWCIFNIIYHSAVTILIIRVDWYDIAFYKWHYNLAEWWDQHSTSHHDVEGSNPGPWHKSVTFYGEEINWQLPSIRSGEGKAEMERK